jgi:hypothetical protein
MIDLSKISQKPSWDTIVSRGLTVFAGIILCGLLLVAYWIFLDRTAPVTVKGGEVLRFEHQADDSWVMIIRWYGDRHRKCWGNSKRWISGDFVLPLPDIPYPPDRPDQELGPFSWEVPVHIPPYYVSTGHVQGQYSIRILYACNPIQEYIFPIPVEPDPIRFVIPTDMPRKEMQSGQLRSSRPKSVLP